MRIHISPSLPLFLRPLQIDQKFGTEFEEMQDPLEKAKEAPEICGNCLAGSST